MTWALIIMAILAIVTILFVFFGASRIQRFLDISRGRAVLLFLLSLIAGIAAGVYRYWMLDHRPEFRWEKPVPGWSFGISILCAGLMVALAIPFVAKLYLKWIGGRLTDAEKTPGMEGVRAWLQGGNLVGAMLLSVCAWLGFGFSFWSVLALTLMALVIYPLLNFAFVTGAPSKTPEESSSSERDRVLRMLDEGKINAHESAELLNALAVAQPHHRTQSSPISPKRKLVLAGLAILLIGFFLPWFSYNPGQEASRVMGEMQANMNRMVPANPGFNAPFASGLKTASVSISGGDIRYGLGWLVLLLGIAAAALPYIAGNLHARDQFKATMAGLAIGAVILIYLLTQNMRFVSVGILLAMVGYVLQFLGTVEQKQSSQA
jgi:hypothetical protein